MSELTRAILITVLILGLIATVTIPIFRGNMDIIHSVAKKEEEISKIKSSDIVNIDKNTVKGSDVIGAIRFYKNDDTVTIKVIKLGGGTETYTTQDYNGASFSIPYEGVFDTNHTYADEKLILAEFTEK